MLYQLNATKSNINRRWKAHIDPEIIQKDFWLKRKFLGNKSYILKIAIAIIVFNITIHSCCIHLFPSLQNRRISDQFNVLSWIIPLIINSTFYFKSPKIMNKIFYLKYELASMLIIAILTFIVGFTMTSYLFYYGEETVRNDYIYTAVYHATFSIAASGHSLISSWWMLRKYESYIGSNSYFDVLQTESNTYRSPTLPDILCDGQYVELFIQYLCGEWKMNVILCFIELVQFKHLIDLRQDGYNLNCDLAHHIKHEYGSDNNSDEHESYQYQKCCLWNNSLIPKSAIIYKSNGNQNIEDMLEIIHKLYCKYIKNDCIEEEEKDEGLTVNISDTMRKCYDSDMNKSLQEFIKSEKMKNIEYIDLFEYFDPIIEEMNGSMQMSLIGFIKSSECDKKANLRQILTEEWTNSEKLCRNGRTSTDDNWALIETASSEITLADNEL